MAGGSGRRERDEAHGEEVVAKDREGRGEGGDPSGENGAEEAEQQPGNHQPAQRPTRGRNVKYFPTIGCRDTHEVDCSPRGLPNSVRNGRYRLRVSEADVPASVK